LNAQTEALVNDDEYAGSWIVRDKSSFKVMHGFKNNAARKLATGDADFDGASESRATRYSLKELRATQDTLADALKAAGISATISLDVPGNALVVQSAETAKIKALAQSGTLTLPPYVTFSDKVRYFSNEAAIQGGGAMNGSGGSCTGGFNVKTTVGGIATAGHCVPYNLTTHRGASIGTRQGTYSTTPGSDLAWYRNLSNTYTNAVTYGTGFYSITSVAPQVVAAGATICIIRQAGDQQCAYAQETATPPGGAGPVVILDRYITTPGDSGGPWLYGSVAYGIHSGKVCDDQAQTVNCKSIFVPAASLSKIGVSVITQ
jgi:hypothetical protein